MAIRLINFHGKPLRIELRGGGALVLGAGQRSRALREELLYDNTHVPEWERQGWIKRIRASWQDVLDDDAAAAAPAAAAAAPKPAGKKSPKPAAKKSPKPARKPTT